MLREKIFGLVTYSARQSLTSFAASLDEMAKNGVEFQIFKFSEKIGSFNSRYIFEDIRLITALLSKPLDFVILNSGSGLYLRPRLFLLILHILRYRNIPTFVLWRNASEKFKKIESRIGNKHYRKIAKTLHNGIHHMTISPQTSRDLLNAMGIKESTWIGNCQYMPDKYQNEVLPDEPPVVVNVAAVSKRKAPDLFIQIAAQVCSLHPTVKFIWAGGYAKKDHESLIEYYGIKDRVEFVGYLSPPYELMQRASAFLLTSRTEGFGLVVAEAMACYRTVFCFQGTGAEFAVGDTGVTIPRFDIDYASKKIVELLNLAPHQRINYRARERYEVMFSPSAYAQNLSKVIKNNL